MKYKFISVYLCTLPEAYAHVYIGVHRCTSVFVFFAHLCTLRQTYERVYTFSLYGTQLQTAIEKF
ncbi:hypothetical protein [Fischerella sp. FACHB-380]|uniref:hypothetical protein n=1 Tax=Fischerella sp. FACHB-380 TaxID=2692799 RepID=UPI0015E0B33E|nr:hypothetical protein [Fischerella sp. FACHB-380]